jgi:hypothetical protein
MPEPADDLITVEVDHDPAAVKVPSPHHHREMLIASAVVVALALAMVVLPGGRVAFRGFEGHPLPHLCATRSWLRINCPGCGLTRSFIRLAGGDVAGSVREHRIGWVLALALLLQFPYRIGLLRRGGRPIAGPRLTWWFSGGLIALLIGNWLYNLVP